MEKILILPLVGSFLVSLFVIPYWIKKSKMIGLVWEDMHKPRHPRNVAGSGGIAVLLGFVVGVLSYIAIKTFILKTELEIIEIFALLTTVLIAGMIGLVDDFLGWVHGGLSWKLRILLLILASVPLVVINAGESNMMDLELGLLYPLILIPIGIVATSSTFNLIAGYNELECSQGIIILGGLSLVTFLVGETGLSLICLIMIVSLVAFFLFNKNPAKVFPGDVLTYSVGSLIGIIAILGNIEKMAIFFFIPYILEVGLKVRGKLKMQSFGKLNEIGGLEVPYEKFYGIEHIAIYILKRWKKEVKEGDVVRLINLFQIVIIILGFILFRNSLFV